LEPTSNVIVGAAMANATNKLSLSRPRR
jgi:hypothetical protein